MDQNKNRTPQKNEEAGYNPTDRNFDHEHVSGKNTPINEVNEEQHTGEKKNRSQNQSPEPSENKETESSGDQA